MRRILVIFLHLFAINLLVSGCASVEVKQTPDRESVKQRSGAEFQTLEEEE